MRHDHVDFIRVENGERSILQAFLANTPEVLR